MNFSLVEIIGFVAAALSTICWFPQSIRTIQTQDTKSISLASHSMFTVSVGLWAIYGWALGSWPLFLCNVIAFVPVAAVLWIKVRNG